MFYDRDVDGVPRSWIAMMKQSIRVLTPVFSGDRMVKDYTERFYLPAAEHYQRLAADGFAKARELAAWKDRVRKAWRDVRVTSVQEEGERELPVGTGLPVTARVHLGSGRSLRGRCSGLLQPPSLRRHPARGPGHRPGVDGQGQGRPRLQGDGPQPHLGHARLLACASFPSTKTCSCRTSCRSSPGKKSSLGRVPPRRPPQAQPPRTSRRPRSSTGGTCLPPRSSSSS